MKATTLDYFDEYMIQLLTLTVNIYRKLHRRISHLVTIPSKLRSRQCEELCGLDSGLVPRNKHCQTMMLPSMPFCKCLESFHSPTRHSDSLSGH